MSPGRRAALALGAVVLTGSVAPAGAGLSSPAHADESYRVLVAPSAFAHSPGTGGASFQQVVLWNTGTASTTLTTTAAVHQLDFAVDPEACDGGPRLRVLADGTTVPNQEILGGEVDVGDHGSRYALPVSWQPGRHTLSFEFLDDHRTATCDRDLRLTYIAASGSTYLWTFQQLMPSGVEVAPSTAGDVGGPRRGWDGTAKLWNDGTLRLRLDSQGARELSIRFTAVRCAGYTVHVRVALDGEVLHDGQLPHAFQGSGGLTNGSLDLDRAFTDGVHTVSVTMSNDLRTPTCDRNLILSRLYFATRRPSGHQAAAPDRIAGGRP